MAKYIISHDRVLERADCSFLNCNSSWSSQELDNEIMNLFYLFKLWALASQCRHLECNSICWSDPPQLKSPRRIGLLIAALSALLSTEPCSLQVVFHIFRKISGFQEPTNSFLNHYCNMSLSPHDHIVSQQGVCPSYLWSLVFGPYVRVNIVNTINNWTLSSL